MFLAVGIFTVSAHAALETSLHITKSDSGVTAADPGQFSSGESFNVLAMTPGVANFLKLQRNGSQTCSTTAMLQNGQWTVFGLDPSTCK
jgi:hypothetical protein